ncbi:MAG: hypothetical protein ABIV47_20430 [Roseiflexaceae bacterium]
MARTIASRRQKTSAGRFVGRFAEQQLFRATLRTLAALCGRSDEQLTDDELSYVQIFLIAAEGGMGKTTLLRRFAAIVGENSEGAGAQALYLDVVRRPAIIVQQVALVKREWRKWREVLRLRREQSRS